MKVSKILSIGINYNGTNAQLYNCGNDTRDMVELLHKRYGEKNVRDTHILTDDENVKKLTFFRSAREPTRANIEAELEWLFSDNKKGDTIIFHYSGHGSQQRDHSGEEEDGRDETLVPSDYATAGQITDDDIRAYIDRLPEGVNALIVTDCCHSGSNSDLRYVYSNTSKKDAAWGRFDQIVRKKVGDTKANVFHVSACKDSQTASDGGNGILNGLFTHAFKESFKHKRLSRPGRVDLLTLLRSLRTTINNRYRGAQVVEISSGRQLGRLPNFPF